MLSLGFTLGGARSDFDSTAQLSFRRRLAGILNSQYAADSATGKATGAATLVSESSITLRVEGGDDGSGTAEPADELFALEAVNGSWLGNQSGNLPARGCAFFLNSPPLTAQP